MLAPRPTPKLEDYPLSAVRDCLFNIFAATLHICRPFFHPQPGDAPCRGDRDPLITAILALQKPNPRGRITADFRERISLKMFKHILRLHTRIDLQRDYLKQPAVKPLSTVVSHGSCSKFRTSHANLLTPALCFDLTEHHLVGTSDRPKSWRYIILCNYSVQ